MGYNVCMNKVTKVAIYARVSTLLGQDISNQTYGLQELITQRGFHLVEIYSDEGISGTKDKRPGLDRLVKDARNGRFSIVLIHSIDRLGRSTKHLLNLMDEFRRYKVSIISLRESLDFSTPYGELALTLISAVAQLEAQLISERIRTSLAVKKALATKTGNGWRCGRPSLSPEIIQDVIALRNRGLSVRKISVHLGNVSKSSVLRIIKEASQNGSEKDK
jgi:DNA invertase Pin-like site-specific DNA recombinase